MDAYFLPVQRLEHFIVTYLGSVLYDRDLIPEFIGLPDNEFNYLCGKDELSIILWKQSN